MGCGVIYLSVLRDMSSKIKRLSFNQDFTCLAVASKAGYKIYNCDPFGLCYGSEEGSFVIVEMLYCTSLLALVGSGEQASLSPRRLQMVNTKRQTLICEFNYSDSICNVKMNRKFLAVSLKSMKLIHTIDLMGDASSGVIALSPSQEPQTLLAYPSPAHKTPISCMVFNTDASLLATCSEKGTVIRVFRLPDCTRMYQFRRGNIPTSIFSLSLSPNGRFLCASSDSTIHIFNLSEAYSEVANNGTNPRRSFSSFLPGLITEVLEPSRDFARIKLQNPTLNISSFNHASNQIYVVTRDGYFFQYQFDEVGGGDCGLIKQFKC